MCLSKVSRFGEKNPKTAYNKLENIHTKQSTQPTRDDRRVWLGSMSKKLICGKIAGMEIRQVFEHFFLLLASLLHQHQKLKLRSVSLFFLMNGGYRDAFSCVSDRSAGSSLGKSQSFIIDCPPICCCCCCGEIGSEFPAKKGTKSFLDSSGRQNVSHNDSRKWNTK